MKIQPILNFNFVNATNSEFHEELQKQIKAKTNNFIVTANPEIVMYAKEHPDFADLIRKANYITPDGVGILYAGKQLNHPLKERITGYDTFLYLLGVANDQNLKVLFYGAKPDVAESLKNKIKNNYPNIKIAGVFDGYLKDSNSVKECIEKTKPNLIFVALGAPKQEEFIVDSFSLTNAIWMGIGGSFDAFTGKVKRAPKIIQKLNLEWFYRLVTNPKRFKRYLAIPRFIKTVKKAKRDSVRH